jgi:hypothetical protein
LDKRSRPWLKWNLPLLSEPLLNESSAWSLIGWGRWSPGDCLAPAARPGFIHRNAGSLASPFIHTNSISFTFCCFCLLLLKIMIWEWWAVLL